MRDTADDTTLRADMGGNPPNLVLISIDTLRADRLPAWGYDGVETPAIDSLAAEGLVFEHAFSNVPLTVPAHATMLTGLLPADHGVRDNLGYRLDPVAKPYLPRLLREAGYRTLGATSVVLLGDDGPWRTGFDVYAGRIEERIALGPGGVQRPGMETLDAILPAVAEATTATEPFFLFLHLYDPHTPYRAPEPWRSLHSDPYDGEVAYADAVVGKLLERLRELGVLDDTAILLTSDHGEGLGDHGEQEHGIFLYRESLHVPMILRLPAGRRGGARVQTVVSLVDIAPTLLGLAGVDADSEAGSEGPGASLLALTEPDEAERSVFAETYYPRLHYGWNELTALVRWPYHYIHGPDPELYDLATDPAQRRNVLADERRVYRSLRDELETLQQPLEAPSQEDAETLATLASLGYAGGQAHADDGPLPDPKSRIGSLGVYDDAIADFGRGDYQAAAAAFRRVVEENPLFVDAWEYLGRTLGRVGRLDDSADAYARALELAPSATHLMVSLAEINARMGRWDDVLAIVGPAVVGKGESEDGPPADVRLYLIRGQALLRMQRFDDAAVAAQAAMDAHPENADPVYLRGSVAIGQQDLERAERLLRRALEMEPNHTAAMGDLAVLLVHRGDLRAARDLLRRVVELVPGDQGTRARLAELDRRIAAQGG